MPIAAALIALQFHRVRSMDLRIGDLKASLTDTHVLALELTQELGYGGLIHNFKNLVLRPEETVYYDRTLANAKEARKLLARLEAQAEKIGVKVKLDNVLAMINAYEGRAIRLASYVEQSNVTSSLDAKLRFNDDHAIQEIHELYVNLSAQITQQEKKLSEQSQLRSALSFGATVLLGGMLLVLLLNHHHKRRHIKATQAINKQLASTNEGLVKANDALQTFAGVVSHDLKTPIRHISYFSEMLVEDYAERELVLEHASQIRAAAGRMDSMIAGLLEFTRTGATQPVLQVVDLSIMVSDVVRDMQRDLELANAEIVTDVSGMVSADPVLLRQVFNNLLSNSLKYVHAERAPEIRVETIADGDQIQVAVSDNGIGIDPKYADQIFEPWQRLHGAHSQFAGDGIGLALVQTVVNAHQGTVSLDTAYVDGTRIVFTLQAA